MSIGSKGIYLHRDSGCRRTNTTSACKAKGRSHTERMDKVEADDEENWICGRCSLQDTGARGCASVVGTSSAGAQEASFVGILKAAKPGPVVGLGSNRDHNGGCSTRFPWIVWKRIRRCRFRQGEPQMVGRGVRRRTDVRPTDYERLGTSQTELPWLLKPFCRQLLLSNK